MVIFDIAIVLVVVALASALVARCREHQPGDLGTITVTITRVVEIDNEGNEVILTSDRSGHLLRAASSNLVIDLESMVAALDGATVGLSDTPEVAIPIELLPATFTSALASDMTQAFDRGMRDCSRLSEDERIILRSFVDDPSLVDEPDTQVCGFGIYYRSDWARFRAETTVEAIEPVELVRATFSDLSPEAQADVLTWIDERFGS